MSSASQVRHARRNGAKGGRPRLVADDEEMVPKRARTVYAQAANVEDPIKAGLLLLGETARQTRRAEQDEAWTALTALHRLACEQVKDIRAARVAASESRTDEQIRAEIEEMSRRLPDDLRASLRVVS